MTETELIILKHLYINPIEDNFTLSVLNSSIGFERNVLDKNIQNLIYNRYVEKVYPGGPDGNHYKMNDPCYRITGFGAKALNELDGKGLKKVIAKYGTIISLIVGVIGAIGVAAKVYFDKRADERGKLQLDIQQQQLQIQQQMLQQKTQGTIPR